MRYLLGIDVGTTGTKTILFSEDGAQLGQAYCPYETASEQLGWSEQNPLDWWNAVVTTVRQVCRDPEIAQNVAGISLSTQGGTTVPVDAEYQPVRPAIVWNDHRCRKEHEEFLQEFGSADAMYQKTGWDLEYGMNALAIRWLRANEPENFQKTAWFLSVPDYISVKMTGLRKIDPSNTGINELGNVRAGGYDAEILRFAGITEAQLPEIVPSGTPIGKLTPAAAAELGLTTETVLMAGAHDQYAVALGAGACGDGDTLIGSGTCWVVTRISDKPDFDSGLCQSVAAVPHKWGSIWSLSSGGVCLEWWRKHLTNDEQGNLISYDTINQEVAARKAAEDGLFFYPFSGQTGNGTDFQRASFLGLDLSHDKYHLARAVMEGVAMQIVWILDAFPGQSGGLKLAGGASKSKLWCQMVADIAGKPVIVPHTADLACVGAAILAGVGTGIFADAADGYKRMAIPEDVIAPDPQKTAMYQEKLRQYQQGARLLGGFL